MQNKILSQYILTTWSNGDVTLEPFDGMVDNQKSGIVIAEKDSKIRCSSRIIQSIEVISNALEKLANINQADIDLMNHIMVKSIDLVAKKARVRSNTVRDKISRQLNISQQQFTHLLWKYHTSKGVDTELKDLLLEKVGQNTRIDDIDLINTSFDRFAELYL